MIGWVVTAIGIVISFVWNLINSISTNRTAARLRGEQYDLNQWARLRARVDQALDGLNIAVATIILEVQELETEEPGNAAIDRGNHRLISAQDELASALEECALSGYCSGDGWLDAANGATIENESAWDTILAVIEEARSCAKKDDKLTCIRKIRPQYARVREAVRQCCTAQDLVLDPKKI